MDASINKKEISVKLNQLISFLLIIISLTYSKGIDKTSYLKPMYLEGDSSGKIVCLVVEDALYELTEDIGFDNFIKIAGEKSVLFQENIGSGKLGRDSLGFVIEEEIKKLAEEANLLMERLLLVYDVTGQKQYSDWRKKFSKMPIVTINTSVNSTAHSFIRGIISGSIQQSYDSIWCKVSLLELQKEISIRNLEIFSSSETCNGPVEECVSETIDNLLRSSISGNSKENSFVNSPHDQHWGKIIGGSFLTLGGIGLLSLSGVIEDDFSSMRPFVGASMLAGGVCLLSIGIKKQVRYGKWKKRYDQ